MTRSRGGGRVKRISPPAPRARSNAATAREQALAEANPELGRGARPRNQATREAHERMKRRAGDPDRRARAPRSRTGGKITRRSANGHAFTCPGECGRHYAVGATAIVLIGTEWRCQACASALQAVGVRRGLDRPCHTCGTPMQVGKINRLGHLVHFPRCPAKG